MKLEECKKQVEDFLTQTMDARFLSQRDRDYKDHKQWTSEEEAVLRKRNQAPIKVNRIKPKVEGMKGLIVQRKTDPKAYPRTQKHEKSAEAVTDALRYVADSNDFDQIKLDVSDNIIVEGYGAAIVQIKERNGEPEVIIDQIPWDRYYYDPHSRRLDFADKMYDGIVLWLDEEDVEVLFDTKITDEDYLEDQGDETFEDRPRWVDKRKRRIKICQHFYRKKGQWWMCFFTASRFLVEPQLSPFLDEYGEPVNPIESQSANVDRDNNRFGEVRFWIDLQDEINHRRSKYLYLLQHRQTMSRRGAIKDVPALKRELSKANGHVEYDGEKGDFDILGTGDMAEAQFLLYQDGKSELDAVGFNAQLSGERQGDLSGRAISTLQQSAINELSSFYAGITSWEKRIYRQAWMRIKQSWTAEKWIRVTDDQQNLRWVGFNQQITMGQVLQEQVDDESLDLGSRLEAQTLLNSLQGNPALNQIQEIRNEVPKIDVDILIDVTMDSINVQNEQFEMLAKIAQTRPEIPFDEIVEMSALRTKTKEKIRQRISQSNQATSQQQEFVQQLQAQESQSKSAEKLASAKKKEVEAEQTMVQTELMLQTPPENTGVVI